MNPLYEIRKKLNMTQEEMAAIIQKKTLRKTDQQCISKWEMSLRVPHFIIIKEYAKIANVDASQLARVLNKLKINNI